MLDHPFLTIWFVLHTTGLSYLAWEVWRVRK
jgi:hypothetical protein